MWRFSIVLIWILSIVLLSSAGIVHGQTPDPGPTALATPGQLNDAGLNPAELWITEEIAAGRVADLTRRFPADSDRRISSGFFEKLITGPAPHQGVRIVGAILSEPLGLRNLTVPNETLCIFCRFEQPVDLSEGHFERSLDLSASSMVTTTFQAMRVDGALGLRGVSVTGSMDLSLMEIGRSIVLDQSELSAISFAGIHTNGNISIREARFTGPAIFNSARASGDLIATTAQFSDSDFGATFSGSTFNNVTFGEARFAGPVDFSHMEVGLDLELGNATFEQGARLDAVLVSGYASISRSQFNGPGIFMNMDVGRDFYSNRVRFTSPDASADFSGMRIGGAAIFTESEFEGSAIFSDMQVGGDFAAYDSYFRHPELPVTWRASRIGGQLLLSNAEFAGPVELVRVSATLGLLMENARFLNPDQRADFSDARFDSLAFIVGSVFSGTTTFSEAEIAGDLFADGIRFTGPDAVASFIGTNVAGNVYMRDGEFNGQALFARAEIDGQLVMDGSRFLQTNKQTQMNGMQVGDALYLRGVTFAAPVDLSDSTFLDLDIGHRDGLSTHVPYLALARSIVGRNLAFDGIVIDHLLAPALHVNGPAHFTVMTVTQSADLQQAQFAHLSLDDVSWPNDRKSVRLDGMTYGQLTAGDGDSSWRTLLDWVNGAAYSANVYNRLSSHFAQLGYPEQADEVYVAQKRRERAEVLGGPTDLNWWWSLFLDIFVRYGRSPGRALAWGALIVAIGCLVFCRNAMQPIDPDKLKAPYSAFWHSLDAFVPFLDLGSMGQWMPRSDHPFARHYLRVHTILGWLLIPIGLAALTGIIK